jgi:hypothetical protein
MIGIVPCDAMTLAVWAALKDVHIVIEHDSSWAELRHPSLCAFPSVRVWVENSESTDDPLPPRFLYFLRVTESYLRAFNLPATDVEDFKRELGVLCTNRVNATETDAAAGAVERVRPHVFAIVRPSCSASVSLFMHVSTLFRAHTVASGQAGRYRYLGRGDS